MAQMFVTNIRDECSQTHERTAHLAHSEEVVLEVVGPQGLGEGVARADEVGLERVLRLHLPHALGVEHLVENDVFVF